MHCSCHCILDAAAGSSGASNSHSVYSSSSGSDSRTVSASSYSSAKSASSYSSTRSGSSYTTDSRPATAKLPAIAGAQAQAQSVKQTGNKAGVVQSSRAAVQGSGRRPDSVSSSASDSGSDSSSSSYTSSSSGYSRYILPRHCTRLGLEGVKPALIEHVAYPDLRLLVQGPYQLMQHWLEGWSLGLHRVFCK